MGIDLRWGSEEDTERLRMWARWYTRARTAYRRECKRRDTDEIDWRELPLIAHPDKARKDHD